MSFRLVNGKAYPIQNIQTNNLNTRTNYKGNNKSFKEILNSIEEAKVEYKVSKHAADRLRDINFTQQDMSEIAKGFRIAENKGAKSSIMLYKDVALIASIENKTLITAIEKERAKENVFTNVDSVVIL